MTDQDRDHLEACIAWAAQQGYCFATEAAEALSNITGRKMYCDQPYYNAFAWRTDQSINP